MFAPAGHGRREGQHRRRAAVPQLPVHDAGDARARRTSSGTTSTTSTSTTRTSRCRCCNSLREGFMEDKAIIEAQQKLFDREPDTSCWRSSPMRRWRTSGASSASGWPRSSRQTRKQRETPESRRVAPVRRADDGLDRPALPLLPSPAHTPRAAVHRDGDDRRAAARRRAAPSRLRRRASIRSRCSSAAASRPTWRVRAPRRSSGATTRSTSTAAARASACSAARSAPA